MGFLENIGFIETEAQERQRLALAPEGSLNRFLSSLPETITAWPEGLVVELPQQFPENGVIVVVPVAYSPETKDEGAEEATPRHRHGGWWTCVVVHSTHASYPVGGHKLSIPGAEIHRGRQLDLASLVTAEATSR